MIKKVAMGDGVRLESVRSVRVSDGIKLFCESRQRRCANDIWKLAA